MFIRHVSSKEGFQTADMPNPQDMSRMAAAIAAAPTREEIQMETFMDDLDEIDDNEDLVEGFFERPHHGFPSGYFKIRSRVDGKAIECHNHKVVLNFRSDVPQQQWYVDSLGRLINRHNNKVLTLHGDIDVKAVPAITGKRIEKQQWYLDKVGRIKNRYNELNLSFDQATRSDTGQVFLVKTANGKEQRWYFERTEQPRQTITLVKDYDGASRHQRIPNTRMYPSNDWTYSLWLRIDSMKVGLGKWKHLFHKGDIDAKDRSPGVWIHPKQPKLHVRITTTKTANDGCDPNYTIKLHSWTHLGIVLEEDKYYVYINGQLRRTCRLKGVVNNNDHPVWIGRDKFAGALHALAYSNFAMTEGELREIMKNTEPARPQKPAMPKQAKISSGLKAKEKVYQELLTKYLELKKKCSGDNSKDKEINKLKAQLERAKMEIELVKAKKCPPKAKCLPVIQQQKSSSINDYPIQTHQDFHKYVLASAIKQPVQHDVSRIKEELTQCQTNFKSFSPSIEMFTGGYSSSRHQRGGGKAQLAADAAMASRLAAQAAQSASKVALAARASGANPYDVTKHKDFPNAVKAYLKKNPQQCAAPATFGGIDLNNQAQVKAALTKYMEKSKCGTLTPRDMSHYMLIKKHKELLASNAKAIKDKYARKDTSTCPPTYKPCLPDQSGLIKTLREQIARLKTETTTTKKELKTVEVARKAEVDNNQKKIIGIKEHPQYKQLMQKYSWVDTSTCPPTFKPCSVLVTQLRNKITTMKTMIEQLKNQLKLTATKIDTNPNYAKHIAKIRADATKACALRVTKARNQPLTQHPKYTAFRAGLERQFQKQLKQERANLLDKYAIRDNTTCPPTYKQCRPGPIVEHPDIHKYVLKSQLPVLLKTKPLNESIQQHPQYAATVNALKRKFLAACHAKKPQAKCETHFS